MKQSGKSIQSKSLNRVLGNIDCFDVQPYQVFIEEEQKKLREYWSVCVLVKIRSVLDTYIYIYKIKNNKITKESLIYLPLICLVYFIQDTNGKQSSPSSMFKLEGLKLSEKTIEKVFGTGNERKIEDADRGLLFIVSVYFASSV